MSLRETVLHQSSDLSVLHVHCSARPGEGAEELSSAFEVVLPMAGVFRRRTESGSAVIDAAAGYVCSPGTEHAISHTTAGDRCIALLPSERLADELAPDDRWSSRTTVRPSRRRLPLLTSALTRDDELAGEEAWTHVVASAVSGRTADHAATQALAQHRRAVEAVREAVATDPGARWTMRAISAVAGYAPHHFSRMFHEHVGMTVSEYRDRVRLANAAVRIRDGATVASVAADLGFADHSHLTRRARAVLGIVPSELRPAA